METMMIADVPISAQTAIIALTKIGSMRVVSTDITTTAPTAVQRWMVMGMRLIDADALMDEFRRFMAKEFDKVKCISEENCKKVYWIQTAKNLENENFDLIKKVGIMAGASTPNSIIEEVKKFLENK